MENANNEDSKKNPVIGDFLPKKQECSKVITTTDDEGGGEKNNNIQ